MKHIMRHIKVAPVDETREHYKDRDNRYTSHTNRHVVSKETRKDTEIPVYFVRLLQSEAWL